MLLATVVKKLFFAILEKVEKRGAYCFIMRLRLHQNPYNKEESVSLFNIYFLPIKFT
jgi:hypothetical protein